MAECLLKLTVFSLEKAGISLKRAGFSLEMGDFLTKRLEFHILFDCNLFCVVLHFNKVENIAYKFYKQ